MNAGTTQTRGPGRGGDAAEETAGSIGEPKARPYQMLNMLRAAVGAAVIALAGVGPAAADVLVSNVTQPEWPFGNVGKLSVNDFAQSFTTGSNENGYQLTSISLRFQRGDRERTTRCTSFSRRTGRGVAPAPSSQA